MKEKKVSNIPVEAEVYEALRQEAKALNVPMNRLLPALILGLKNKNIREETMNRLFIYG